MPVHIQTILLCDLAFVPVAEIPIYKCPRRGKADDLFLAPFVVIVQKG